MSFHHKVKEISEEHRVVQENIHTSPTEVIFVSPRSLWKFSLSFTHVPGGSKLRDPGNEVDISSKFFGLPNPCTPRKFQSLLCSEFEYFLEMPSFKLCCAKSSVESFNCNSGLPHILPRNMRLSVADFSHPCQYITCKL